LAKLSLTLVGKVGSHRQETLLLFGASLVALILCFRRKLQVWNLRDKKLQLILLLIQSLGRVRAQDLLLLQIPVYK